MASTLKFSSCPFRLMLVLVVGLSGLRTAHAQLQEDVLKKVKRGTVHLKAKLANGGTAEGSGWFVERGLIITNAHVLNMHGGDKRMPSKIEVTIDGGEKTSRTVSATFRGAAYEADLLLLKVDADPETLPDPLTLNPDAELNETQEVYVLGFPLGKALGKAITISKSSISSLRKEDGQLKEIQLNGGMHSGNSGGPIINQAGEVIGVAVSGLEGTTINFAIPGELAAQLVHGKFLNLKLEQSYLDGEQIKLPVKVNLLDPFKRITEMQLEYWTTPKADFKPRPLSLTRPEPEEGDGPISTVSVPSAPTGAPTMELTLPPLPDETSVYWVRATFKDGRGRTYWSPASGNLRPVPLDRREITLKFKPTAGSGRPFQITNDSAFKVKVGTRTESLSMLVRVEASPTWSPPDADGDTRGKLRYSSVTLGLKQNGEPINAKEKWNPLGKSFLKTLAEVRLSDEGAVVYAQPDLRQADPKFKSELVGISDLVLQTLELMSVPLPQHPIQPKERIRVQRMLLVGLPELYFPSQADVKYQYLGVRKKYEHETAYFDISADLRPRRGDDSRLTGRLNGTLEISLETGEIIHGSSTMNIDFESLGSTGGRLIGTLSAKIAAIDARPKAVLKPADLDAQSMPVPSGHEFAKGQSVFVLSEGLWHQSEVLAVNTTGQPKIHFIGWADSWDVFVTPDRVRIPK